MKALAKLKQELQELEAMESLNTVIQRGSIAMIDLPIVGGSVQTGLRPCVIVSNNKANKFSPNIIAIPLTSRTKKPMPTHHKILPSITNGLKVESTALAEQILTISKDCIKKVIGMLDEQHLEKINEILKQSIGLF